MITILSCKEKEPASGNKILALKSNNSLKSQLINKLDSIYDEDQDLRVELMPIIDKYGVNSKEAQKYWTLIRTTDSVNLIKVSAIIDEYGWPGPDIIGKKGNSALFLVIQHADKQTWEKYLPVMRPAVKNKNASASDLALMEDRLALAQGKKQIYGSQLGRNEITKTYYVLPIENPDQVDVRRQKMGLSKMSIHLSGWGIKWDLKKYKKENGAL